ncbi:type II toxin-antitoxin system HicA family toxin [Phragmitibacter flavus]|uniref:Type II toxin-antitoxin system HicA family toxin n=1 Tax=Phragmitibacter flavus TaxID=2576071 RepID=A0A5R8K974_9BACT|nr:type II toxin-antitoxin system HicA family toxin [Phragmitibacter flavus]
MKRRDLVKQLELMGCELIRHGGKHDWFQNRQTGACQPVPQHTEINEYLAKSIIKKLSNL